MTTLALGVLISGRGSNLGAVLEAIAQGTLDASVRVVVANRSDAHGLERARAAKVPAVIVEHGAFAQRADFERAVLRELEAHGVEWVVLAGFMRVLSATFLGAFPWRVLNIHPALCPAFPGPNAIERALRHGVRVTGCTVHFVDEGVDTGPIVAQSAVEVLAADTRDTLAARVLEQEHRLLVQVLQWLAQGRVWLEPPQAPDGRPRVVTQAQAPEQDAARHLWTTPAWPSLPRT